ncbi:unnamed protein product [Vitrella brassicaformis CCMP3155]|uniref:RNA-editing substrate-binding complex 6 protein domain-containing protein n=2 Tax=Vitrella brassicaformis TaxID=1169539 RepID=A0A0G4GV97_VITBC|nr:unnamed protein product [Vitrella brassicaformis CCMP3155]|eukprot:CEM34787.1 unnamed protein product [Vitrella brassicaformis CCMP3155]
MRGERPPHPLPMTEPGPPMRLRGRVWPQVSKTRLDRANHFVLNKAVNEALRLQLRHPHLWSILSRRAFELRDRLDGVDIYVFAVAIAKLNISDVPLMEMLSEEAIKRHHLALATPPPAPPNNQQAAASELVPSFCLDEATEAEGESDADGLNDDAHESYEGLVRRRMERINRPAKPIEFRQLAGVAGAWARVSYVNVPLLEAVAEGLPDHIHQLNGQDIGLICEAFTAAQLRSTVLLKMIAGLLTDSSSPVPFSATNLASVAKCFAALSYRSREAWRALTRQTVMQVGEFPPRRLAVVLKAFAQAAVREPRVFRVAGEYLLSHVEHLGGGDIATVLYAYAFLELRHNRLFDEMSKLLPRRVSEMACSDMLNALLSFSLLDYRPPLALNVLLAHIHKHIRCFSGEEICIALSLLRRLRIKHEPLLASLGRLVEGRVVGRVAAPQSAMSVAYQLNALAEAGLDDTQLFKATSNALAPLLTQDSTHVRPHRQLPLAKQPSPFNSHHGVTLILTALAEAKCENAFEFVKAAVEWWHVRLLRGEVVASWLGDLERSVAALAALKWRDETFVRTASATLLRHYAQQASVLIDQQEGAPTDTSSSQVPIGDGPSSLLPEVGHFESVNAVPDPTSDIHRQLGLYGASVGDETLRPHGDRQLSWLRRVMHLMEALFVLDVVPSADERALWAQVLSYADGVVRGISTEGIDGDALARWAVAVWWWVETADLLAACLLGPLADQLKTQTDKELSSFEHFANSLCSDGKDAPISDVTRAVKHVLKVRRRQRREQDAHWTVVADQTDRSRNSPSSIVLWPSRTPTWSPLAAAQSQPPSQTLHVDREAVFARVTQISAEEGNRNETDTPVSGQFGHLRIARHRRRQMEGWLGG